MKRKLSDIVLFCSGVNVSFLRNNCPNERHKYYPIGLGVMTTTLLAFISMMFASHAIFRSETFQDEIWLTLFSLFWAFAIFTIDWGLVKTMTKSANLPSTFIGWVRAIAPVLFRVIVAVILSYSISKPLEVKIFEQRLAYQIEVDRVHLVGMEDSLMKARLEGTKSEIVAQKKAIDTIEQKRNSYPLTIEFRNDTVFKREAEDILVVTKTRNNPAINRLAEENRALKDPDRRPEAYTTNESGRHVRKAWASGRINANNAEMGLLNAEIKQKEDDVERLKKKVAEHIANHVAKCDSDMAVLAGQQVKMQAGLDSSVSKNQTDLQNIDTVAKKAFDPEHPGLITQLEALSNFEMTEAGKSAKNVRWILLLVIICIDTAPIVIKLLTKRGVYDEQREADEEKMEFLSRYETYANKYLIRQLSSAQKEVLKKAIMEWKEKQLKRQDLSDEFIVTEEDGGSLPILTDN